MRFCLLRIQLTILTYNYVNIDSLYIICDTSKLLQNYSLKLNATIFVPVCAYLFFFSYSRNVTSMQKKN